MFYKKRLAMALIIATFIVGCGPDDGGSTPPPPQDGAVLDTVNPCEGGVGPDAKKPDAMSGESLPPDKGTTNTKCKPGNYHCVADGLDDDCKIDGECHVVCPGGNFGCYPGISPLKCNGGYATCTLK